MGFGKHTDPMVGVRFGEGQDPTKGGRPRTLKIRELLRNIDEDDNKIEIPLSNCEVTKTHVILTIPSRDQIAMILQTNAKGDVNWFKEWAKVMGEYAPIESVQTAKMDHTLRDMTDQQLKDQINEIRERREQFNTEDSED